MVALFVFVLLLALSLENAAIQLDPAEDAGPSGSSPSSLVFIDSLSTLDGKLLHDPIKLSFGNSTIGAQTDDSFDSNHWRAVWVLSAMILLAISPIAVKEGLIPFLTVVMYLACLSLVKMFVKETMKLGFAFPQTITAVHMASTALFAASLERPCLSEALMVFPISAVTGASLLLNNTALVHGGVAFVTMVACTTPIFTFALELFRGSRGLEWRSVGSVVVVCLGSAFCVHGEKAASLMAAVLAAGATGFRAMKSVWQHELLTVNVSPLRLLFWSGFWSFVLTIPMIGFSEGMQAATNFPATSTKTKIDLCMSIVSAVVLNCCQCFAVKQLGALMQSIVGNLNLILVIVLSQAWLHEQVTVWQYVGVALLVGGTVLSKIIDKKKPSLKEKRSEQALLSNPEAAPESYSATVNDGACNMGKSGNDAA